MTNICINMKTATRFLLVAMILVLAFATISFAQGYRYKDNPWSFGVNGDTQWTEVDPATGLPLDPTGENPNRVSAALARKMDAEFVKAGVQFVIQTGDLTDYAGPGLATRAKVAEEDLFNYGVGFFPLRGNHETYGYFIPGYDPNYNLNVPDFRAAFPQTQGLANTFGASNFSSPSSVLGTGVKILDGLSYSFDYGISGNNARFVIVDTEQTSVMHQDAPKNVTINSVKVINPDGTITVKNITIAQGYFYLGWTVFQYSEPISSKIGVWNPALGEKSNYKAWVTVDGTIPAGKWWRINSAGLPASQFYGWEEYGGAWPLYKADGTADYTFLVTETNNSANTEFFPGKQQGWISNRLDQSTRGTKHAFVFSHRPMINGNHTDSFFGVSSAVTPADQNAFYSSLANNNVKFMISGHDHLYNRALDKSPDGNSKVMQIITQGISTKFYTPTRLDDFGYDDAAKTMPVKLRETQISQEVNNFGYYIYTVDGPRVTVNYYSDSVGNFKDSEYYPNGDPNADPPVLGTLKVPNFNFVKQDTWGYSLNGKQFTIPQSTSYTVVADSFGGTEAKIIGGNNNSTTADLTPVAYTTEGVLVSGPRPLNKVVNTGWVAKPTSNPALASNIFSLWGMTEFSKNKSDVYVLQMSFVDERPNSKNKDLGNGGYRLAAIDANGNWANAVQLNIGAQKQKFVQGPYNASYGLGTYGIDMNARVVWAVINYDADFAAVKF
jgi:hypothetical protein